MDTETLEQYAKRISGSDFESLDPQTRVLLNGQFMAAHPGTIQAWSQISCCNAYTQSNMFIIFLSNTKQSPAVNKVLEILTSCNILFLFY